MSKIKFTGIMPAFVTPLDKNGNINRQTVKQMAEHFLAVGCKGFYVCGSTGEGVVLSARQRMEMCEAIIEANAGRGQVIIQTGSINAEETMALTRHATQAGADGISSVLPSFYYNYNFDEVCDYYKRLADNTSLPVIAYAVPITQGNTDINKMVEHLLTVDNIIGVKDTRANYHKMLQLKQLNGGDINIINGPDESLICGLMVGADGGIGSTYNLMPKWYVELYRRFTQGDIAGAREMQIKINRVIDVLLAWADGDFIRALKEALGLAGFDCGGAVYPARRYSAEKLAKFKESMENAGYAFTE